MRRKHGTAFAEVIEAIKEHGPCTNLEIRERVAMSRLDIHTHCLRGIEKGVLSVTKGETGINTYAFAQPIYQPARVRVASVWQLGTQ